MGFWPARRNGTPRFRAPTAQPAAGGHGAIPLRPAPASPTPEPAAPVRLSARKLRHAREAQDAIKAAAILRQPLTLDRAEALLAILEPYRRRASLPAGANPLHGLVGQSPARLHEIAMRHAAPVLLDVFLPAAREHMLDRLVGVLRPLEGDEAARQDGGLPSAIDLANAMRTMIGALRGAGRQHALAVIDAVIEDSRAMVQRASGIGQTPGSQGGQPADHSHTLGEFSHTLLRLEALRLIMETLGARSPALDALAYQSRRVARLALRQAAAAINGFVRERNLLTLRDSLLVIAKIDSLIVVALRILDSLQAHEEEATPFVKVADEEALDDYVEAIVRLAEALVQLTTRTLASPDFDELLFVALLRKIKWLYRFCDRLGHAHRPKELDELRDYLGLQSAMLGRQCAEALSGAVGDPVLMARLLPRADELVLLLGDVGRLKVRDMLAERVAVARNDSAPTK
ncbi:hypothetical protein [Azospirillum sp.]|uniref:hypothetical protein n=1 Tax=Azospirillum sp. TaxID=34012 RepID=UPI002D68260A|nr:hypothetical protein [Azospirillum sp.]HYD64381.1 hypothetical protein [Azospirillum sp.]